MKILHLTQQDYKTSAWAGGTTTEIFIWPEGADYTAREFAFRISSARVELEESDFSALPGITRFITPLSGGFTLRHPDAAPVVMAPLEKPYRFDGGTPTHCTGSATDFNLMLQGTEGEMTLAQGRAEVLPGFNGFYAVEGGIYSLAGQAYPMNAGDFLAVFADSPADICLSSAVCCYVKI